MARRCPGFTRGPRQALRLRLLGWLCGQPEPAQLPRRLLDVVDRRLLPQPPGQFLHTRGEAVLRLVSQQAARLGDVRIAVADISRAIQSYVEGNGFSVVREFVGHGVGRTMHEEPQVPNFVDPRSNQKLRPGMTLAIEPKIVFPGRGMVGVEDTLLVTAGPPECLTVTPRELVVL